MRACICLGLILLTSTLAAQDTKVAVFVTPKPAPLDTKGFAEAKIRAAVAMSEWSRVNSELEGKHGRNTKKWPAEDRDRMLQLSDAEYRARFEADHLFGTGLEMPQIEALVPGLHTQVGKTKGLRLAPTLADADVVLEVLSCVARKSDAVIGVRLRPGGRLDEASLVAAAPAWAARSGQVKGGIWSSTQHKPVSASEPFWLVAGLYPGISQDLPKSCDYAGATIVVSLEAFAKDHRVALAKARKP